MSIYIGDKEIKDLCIGDSSAKEVYLGDTKVRPSGWKPGANTIAYYKLNSTTQLTDSSSNGRTLTKNGTATFGEYQGVNCCYINGGDLMADVNISFPTNLTVNIWYYKNGTPPGGDNGSIAGYSYNSSNMGELLCSVVQDNGWLGSYGLAAVSYKTSGTEYITYNAQSGWNNVVATHNGSTLSFYVNGTLINSVSNTNTQTIHKIGISRYTGLNRSINGYVSEAIFENKVRTAQEISDYYNLTKGNYGL